jgi:PadR family transcriptional regulator, regulatory protein PadR
LTKIRTALVECPIMTGIRMTHNTLTVLRALMTAPDREMYGLEIMRGLSMGSGTVYPLLDRANDAGWVTVRAEKIDPQAKGRPPRRYYRITDAGIQAAREAIGREQDSLAALGITATAPDA